MLKAPDLQLAAGPLHKSTSTGATLQGLRASRVWHGAPRHVWVQSGGVYRSAFHPVYFLPTRSRRIAQGNAATARAAREAAPERPAASRAGRARM